MRLYLYRLFEAGTDPWEMPCDERNMPLLRESFAQKGGKTSLMMPYRAFLAREWDDMRPFAAERFVCPAWLRIPVVNTMAQYVSFTYGDASLAAEVYTLGAIIVRVRESDWPQDAAREGMPSRMPRWIEAQIWRECGKALPN